MKKLRWRWPAIDAGEGEAPSTLSTRLLWMAGIWAASIGVLSVVAMLLRWVLKV